MDDSALLLRIRVVLVSTRAAVHSLDAADPQVEDVLERGRWLLSLLEDDVRRSTSPEARERFEEARAELSPTVEA